jgi:hypothetical protein
MNENAEIWKDVVGFEGYYVVSNMGRIMRVKGWRNHAAGRIRKPSVTRCGYLSATLSKDGKQTTKSIHQWVADAFLEPRPDGHEINHINGDKSDNRAENLQWVTHAQNAKYNYDELGRVVVRGSKIGISKLHEDDIPKIRALHGQGLSNRKIGDMFGVSNTTIWFIIHGTEWTHV